MSFHFQSRARKVRPSLGKQMEGRQAQSQWRLHSVGPSSGRHGNTNSVECPLPNEAETRHSLRSGHRLRGWWSRRSDHHQKIQLVVMPDDTNYFADYFGIFINGNRFVFLIFWCEMNNTGLAN